MRTFAFVVTVGDVVVAAGVAQEEHRLPDVEVKRLVKKWCRAAGLATARQLVKAGVALFWSEEPVFTATDLVWLKGLKVEGVAAGTRG